MNTKSGREEYLEKAKLLNRDEVEHLFSRMRGKYARRLDDNKINPLEAAAKQLEYEDERLGEWRARVSELRKKSKN
jgi:hypothetical protein